MIKMGLGSLIPEEKRREKRKKKESLPHQYLWERIALEWRNRAVYELKNGVPGRRYVIDIAFPDIKLAIEIDGWQYHGKYLEQFKKDRIRQNALAMNGWRVLRYFHGQIMQNREDVVDEIREAIRIIESEKRHSINGEGRADNKEEGERR